VDGLSGRAASARTESVASGVRAGAVDGACVDPILGEDCRTRELSGVAGVVAEDRVELSLGVGVTLLDGLGAGVELAAGGLDRDCISRRRAAMRSTMDCRPLVLRSEILGDALSAIGLGGVPAPIRLPMPAVAFELMPPRDDDKDRSLDGLLLWDPIVPPIEGLFHEGVRLGSGARTDGREGAGVNDLFGLGDRLGRNDGVDRFGLTEVLGRLGLTDGLGRLKDVFGRLGLIDGLGLGATGLDRMDIRFCRPLGALGLGAD